MTSKTARTGDKIRFEGEKIKSLRIEEHRKFVWVGLVSEI